MFRKLRWPWNAYILLFVFWGIPHLSFAQFIISGKVVDSSIHTPLSGVTVQAGSSSVQTDANGYFELKIDSDAGQISFTTPGYDTVQLALAGWNGEKIISLNPNSITLPEVEVQSSSESQKLLNTAGSLSVLTEEEMDQGDKVNAAPILNTIAGVEVNQADMEDSRISIRGDGLRSSYGTRDVSLYLDGIPLNEADGFSRIEGLDLFDVGSAEIIKGPNSSLYGASIGGAILFESVRPSAGETVLETSDLIGSYGLDRESASLKTDLGNADILVSYGNQDFGGYVNHTEDSKTFATGVGTFYPSNNDTLTVLVNQSDEKADFNVPETLNQFENAPTLGDPNNTLYNIHRDELWTRFGASNNYIFSDQFENTTSIYSSQWTLDHPYGYGYSSSYLQGQMQNFGGRSELTYRPTTGNVATRLTGGAELMNEYTNENYYTNTSAVTLGPLDSVNNNTERHVNVFLEGELDLEKNTFLTAGLNYNNTVYTQTNTYLANDSYFNLYGTTLLTPAGATTMSFSPTTSFRVALSHVFDDQFSLYGDISQGFSPPIFDETTNPINGGLLNTGLLPESETQYEIGTRGHLLKKNFNYDIALYDAEENHELVPFEVSDQTEYQNAGLTHHKGVEISLSYDLANTSDRFFTLARPWFTYSYQDYVFGNGLVDGVNYAGNQLPGNSANQFNAGFNLETKSGFYFNTNYQWLDAVALDNANDAWDPAYGLWSAKIGFKRQYGPFKLDIYGGAYNLLNVVYNAYPVLNGTDGAYYEPGLPQNFYGGLTLGYLF